MRDPADVYRAHARAVLAYLRAQRAPDPEDLLGEVFLHVARAAHRFEGDDDHLRAWVFTIARNRLIDDRRRRARRPHVSTSEVPEGAGPEHAADPDRELTAALAALTPEQREVVVLRFIADLPITEVAAITGRDAGAVKAMQHRAMAQLARILRPPDGALPDDG